MVVKYGEWATAVRTMRGGPPPESASPSTRTTPEARPLRAVSTAIAAPSEWPTTTGRLIPRACMNA